MIQEIILQSITVINNYIPGHVGTFCHYTVIRNSTGPGMCGIGLMNIFLNVELNEIDQPDCQLVLPIWQPAIYSSVRFHKERRLKYTF